MAVMSNTIGNRLCDALGLPKGVRSIQINFEANELVTAVVTLLPESDVAEEVVEIVKRFELAEKDEPAAGPEPAWMARIDELAALAKAEINQMARDAHARIAGKKDAASLIRELIQKGGRFS